MLLEVVSLEFRKFVFDRVSISFESEHFSHSQTSRIFSLTIDGLVVGWQAVPQD